MIVDCDVLQADGGTRTASICGGYLALHDALSRVVHGRDHPAPTRSTAFCAAISVGIVDGVARARPALRRGQPGRGGHERRDDQPRRASSRCRAPPRARRTPAPSSTRCSGWPRAASTRSSPCSRRWSASRRRPADAGPAGHRQRPQGRGGPGHPRSRRRRSSATTRGSRRPARPSRRTRCSRRARWRRPPASWRWPTTPASRSTTSTARPASTRPAGPARATGSHGCSASSTASPPEGRACRYVCAAAAVWPDGREVVVRGDVEGASPTRRAATGGFGYDPIVAPVEGDGRTFAEMTADEKHAISHRASAFRRLWTLGSDASCTDVGVTSRGGRRPTPRSPRRRRRGGGARAGTRSGSTWAGITRTRSPTATVAPSARPKVMCSSDTNQQSPTSSTVGSPWSMPNALRPASSTPHLPVVLRDHRGLHEQRVLEVGRVRRVLGVHQAVASRPGAR